QQTVKDRQTVSDQVGALFKSKLKSELDLSFANVNLAQAKLLLLDAQNNVNDLITTALTMRPEILALEFQSESARRFQKAERDLLFPDIQALGAVGDT